MTIIVIRTIILYSVVLFVVRMMGKSELSKMSPFQMVIIFMIAELASLPIESPHISLINGVAAVLTLFFLQVLISFLSIKCEGFKNFVSGTPSVLIDNGKINVKEMRELRISINDLMEQLRLGNSPALSDVQFAVMESNGQLSIIPKAGKQPLTPDDMAIFKQQIAMPLVVVSDGYIYEGNLKAVGYDRETFSAQLRARGIGKLSDVFLAFSDENKVIHIYKRNKEMSEEVFTI